MGRYDHFWYWSPHRRGAQSPESAQLGGSRCSPTPSIKTSRFASVLPLLIISVERQQELKSHEPNELDGEFRVSRLV
jgi:hypothetical protein